MKISLPYALLANLVRHIAVHGVGRAGLVAVFVGDGTSLDQIVSAQPGLIP
jgi:hypothetical protein